jgi:ATP-dependent Zn protease
MFNEKTNKSYIETQIEIEAEIERLQDRLADHNQSAVHLNRKHVEDLKHVLIQLKQINGKSE